MGEIVQVPVVREITAIEASKILKRKLRDAFPTTKFSVTSKGAIRVHWTDGPTVKRVEAIANAFEGRGFDGMTDCGYSTGNTFEFGGATFKAPRDFVFCTRHESPELTTLARTHIEGVLSRHGMTLHPSWADCAYRSIALQWDFWGEWLQIPEDWSDYDTLHLLRDWTRQA